MTIYLMTDILVGLFEAVMIYMLFKAFLGKREDLSEPVYIIGILVVSLLMVTSNKFFSFGLLNLVIIMFFVFLFSLLFDGNFKTKIIVSILSILLFTSVEVVILFLLAFVIQVSVTEAVDNAKLRFFGIIISKISTFAIVKMICFRAKKHFIRFNTKHWVLFLGIFITSILAIFLIFKLQYDNAVTYMYTLSVICSVGLLLITFFSLYLYESMAIQSEEINRQKIFEQQVKAQAKHLDEILLSQKQLKILRHDLKNHLITLASYFKEDRRDEGLDYIKRIEKTANLNHTKIDTGNIALDAIINSKRELAKSKKIDLNTHLQIPEGMPIEPIDVCIIFGNALDNAIEACEKIKDGNKNITLSIIYENSSIACKIVNTSYEKQNALLKTTKPDRQNHGFGVENIQTALKKYKNVLKITQTDNEFILSFIIFI